MYKLSSWVLGITFLMAPFFVFAQENQATGFIGAPPGNAAGNAACFDFYTFGSVKAEFSPALPQTVPGATISFNGTLKNENQYPLPDGTLFVKIFKKSATFSASSGDQVVDQFAVQEKFTLPANGEKEVTINWRVPDNLPSGNYSAAFSFLTEDRLNFLGLPFTDDVVGQRTDFAVTNSEETSVVVFDRSKVSLNDQPYALIGFPPIFKSDEAVTVKVNLVNSSSEAKQIPVSWKEYRWDSLQSENSRDTKVETVTIAPNETKEISYTVTPKSDSVAYLVVETNDGGTKSILNIRFARDGVQDARLNFAGLLSYPLRAGQENAIAACAHAIGYASVPDTTLILTLKDAAGKIIHEYKYEGEQSSNMGGFKENFIPKHDYANITLVATLYHGRQQKEQVEIQYTCEDIDPSLCQAIQDPKASESALSGLFSKFLIIFAIVIVALLIIVAIRRMRKPPVQFIWMLAFILGSGVLFNTGVGTVEAKNASIEGVEDISMDLGDSISGGGAATYTINYYADAINVDTGTVIADGSTLAVGTRIKFVPKPRNDRVDIVWNFSGSFSGTPYGWWGSPTTYCEAGTHYGGGWNAPMTQFYQAYLTYTVEPTASETSVGGTAGLQDQGLDAQGNRTYLVQSPGNISADVRFLPTNSSFIGLKRINDGSACSGGSASEEVSLPERTISFDFTVSGGSTNQRPNAPTIIGPVSGSPNNSYTFTATATDPDGDQIRYQFDWDRNGIPDECSPSSCALVNSGTSRSADKSWSSNGAKTFQVRVQDSYNQYSSWTSHTISLTTYTGQPSACGPASTTPYSTTPPADQLCIAPSTAPSPATLDGYSWRWTCNTPATSGSCSDWTSGNCAAQGYSYQFSVYVPDEGYPAAYAAPGYCWESSGNSVDIYFKACTAGTVAYYSSCIGPYESGPPSSLKLCEGSCGSGVEVPSSFTMSRNSTKDVVACWNTASACTDGSGNVSASASWGEGGGNTISLSGTNPKRINADNSGTESMSASYSGQTANRNITVACIPTVTCDNAPGRENYCENQSFNVDNGCGSNISCNGTKTCNYNWKEVAP